MRVIVIGGGVAGAAAAVALRTIEADVVVLERQAAGTGARGSFLTLAPNALSAVERLGVLDAVIEAGVATDGNIVLGADSRRLGSIGLGAEYRPGLTAITIRRSVLADLLRAAAEKAGAHFSDGTTARYAVERDAADVTLEDGIVRTGDVVLAADGVGSRTRRLLDPAAPAPRSLGLLNFGGMTRSAATHHALAARSWSMTFGRQAFFGALPTPAGDVAWFANVPSSIFPDGDRPPAGDPDWRARLVALLRADPGPAAAIVEHGEIDLAGHPTVDLPPVRVWHDHHCVLLGDAAHAPAPSSGQGAGMALEDAVVLAHHLRGIDPTGLPAALDAFTAARRSRVDRVVAGGRRTSSSKTASSRLRPAQEHLMAVLLRSGALERGSRTITGWRAPSLAFPQP